MCVFVEKNLRSGWLLVVLHLLLGFNCIVCFGFKCLDGGAIRIIEHPVALFSSSGIALCLDSMTGSSS